MKDPFDYGEEMARQTHAHLLQELDELCEPLSEADTHEFWLGFTEWFVEKVS